MRDNCHGGGCTVFCWPPHLGEKGCKDASVRQLARKKPTDPFISLQRCWKNGVLPGRYQVIFSRHMEKGCPFAAIKFGRLKLRKSAGRETLAIARQFVQRGTTCAKMASKGYWIPGSAPTETVSTSARIKEGGGDAKRHCPERTGALP